jgi:hypothetical protein
MLLCLIISFFFDPVSTFSYLLFVLGTRAIRVYESYWRRARMQVLQGPRALCWWDGESSCARGPSILFLLLKSLENLSFWSSVGSFIAKSVLPPVNLFSYFASAASESPPGSTHRSQENILLSPPRRRCVEDILLGPGLILLAGLDFTAWKKVNRITYCNPVSSIDFFLFRT